MEGHHGKSADRTRIIASQQASPQTDGNGEYSPKDNYGCWPNADKLLEGILHWTPLNFLQSYVNGWVISDEPTRNGKSALPSQGSSADTNFNKPSNLSRRKLHHHRVDSIIHCGNALLLTTMPLITWWSWCDYLSCMDLSMTDGRNASTSCLRRRRELGASTNCELLD